MKSVIFLIIQVYYVYQNSNLNFDKMKKTRDSSVYFFFLMTN